MLWENVKLGKGDGGPEEGMELLSHVRIGGRGLSAKAMSDQRPRGSEGVSHADT